MINPANRATIFLHIASIIILGLVIYFNSLKGEFIWDDRALVTENRYIKDWSNIPGIFTKTIGAGIGAEINFYRPLQMLTYMADYFFWELNPAGYHLTNVFLHVCAALALYWFILILFNNLNIAFLAAALFTAHPVHTEAVSYIAGRADSLAALFTMLCLIFYFKQASSPQGNKLNFFLMLCCFISALLSKESALIIPLLILFYCYIFQKRLKAEVFWSTLGIVFIYLLWVSRILKPFSTGALSKTTLLQRLPGFFASMAEYLRVLVWPFDLHMEYGNKLISYQDPRVAPGALLLIASLAYAFIKRKDAKLTSFAIGWYFICLLPVSNLYPINAFMAEHWLYLPSAGFFLLLASGLNRLKETKSMRFVSLSLIAGVLTFFTCLTIKQNYYWQDKISFYIRTLRYTQDSPRIYNNLCKACAEKGRNKEAVFFCKKAISLKSGYAEAYLNLGNAYMNLGNARDSLNAYNRAGEIKPDFADAYNNIGLIYSAQNNEAKAAAFYQKAVQINPDYADAYYNLGNAFNRLGKIEEAITSYAKAIEIDPKGPRAGAYYNNLAVMYAVTGKKEEAIALYEKIAVLYPDLKAARQNLENLKESR